MIHCSTCSRSTALILCHVSLCKNWKPEWQFWYLTWPSYCTHPLLFLWEIRNPSKMTRLPSEVWLQRNVFSRILFSSTSILGGARDFSGLLNALWTFFSQQGKKGLAGLLMPRANINIYNYSSQLVLNPTKVWPWLRRHCFKEAHQSFSAGGKPDWKENNSTWPNVTCCSEFSLYSTEKWKWIAMPLNREWWPRYQTNCKISKLFM